MSEKKNWNGTSVAKRRRRTALERLTTQLSDGNKTQKKSTNKTSLVDADKKRIAKEIDTLKNRL